MIFQKLHLKLSLVRCFYHPSASSFARQKEKRARTRRGMIVRSRSRNTVTVIAVENNTRHNQNHGSRRIKDFFFVSRKIVLENHGSRLLMKSRCTRKNQAISHFAGRKLGHSQITKMPNKIKLVKCFFTVLNKL